MDFPKLNKSDKMKEKCYCTSDLSLAAYLLVKGFPLSGIRRVSSTKASFEFEDSRDREEEVLQFFNRNRFVEPLAYWESVKILKAMIYN